MVLKGIDPLLNGELLNILDEMGHGDELVVADRNFPSWSQELPVVRVAAGAVDVTEAILSVFPLDTFVDHPLERMGPQDDPSAVNDTQTAVLQVAKRVFDDGVEFGLVPRFDFYERAKGAYAVVQTAETEAYCCFILTKGVI